jgi:hypothetical protein
MFDMRIAKEQKIKLNFLQISSQYAILKSQYS